MLAAFLLLWLLGSAWSYFLMLAAGENGPAFRDRTSAGLMAAVWPLVAAGGICMIVVAYFAGEDTGVSQ